MKLTEAVKELEAWLIIAENNEAYLQMPFTMEKLEDIISRLKEAAKEQEARDTGEGLRELVLWMYGQSWPRKDNEFQKRVMNKANEILERYPNRPQ